MPYAGGVMSEPVNLNRFRKAKDRSEKQATAAANRTKFGRSKAEKARDKAETERVDALLDGARQTKDGPDSPS